jgi:hypothetical protein
MRDAAPFFRTAVAKMSNAGIAGGSEYLAQIATRHFDDPAAIYGADGFGRDPEVFGYVILGPLLAGFADWLHEGAIDQGIEKLGFLTREGPILRSAYEALYPNSQIETSTVVASRRIVRNADHSHPEVRETLRQYLSHIGLSPGKAGLVDIGYAGQIQAGYSDISGNSLSGFYFATFRTSKEVLGDLPSASFLASGVAANDKKHGICRHRQIYEMLLCAPGPSFVGLERDGDGWRGVTAEGADTPIRDEFVSAAHKGALEFVADYAANRTSPTRVSPAAATALLDAVLDDPTPGLAEWLGQLEFDDSFDLDAMSKLIAPEGSASRSVWPEGARMLGAKSTVRRPRQRKVWRALGPYGFLGWRHALTPVVAQFVGRIGDAKDADHFRDDPIGFFRRLSDPRYRRIGRILYPWD